MLLFWFDSYCAEIHRWQSSVCVWNVSFMYTSALYNGASAFLRPFNRFVILKWVSRLGLIVIFMWRSGHWKNNCICSPPHAPCRTCCTVHAECQHHHAHHILGLKNKQKQKHPVYSILSCWSCIGYLWARLPPPALPHCKTNTALLDELSYRLKHWMNIHRSC